MFDPRLGDTLQAMASACSAISTRSLTRRFGDCAVVDAIDLEVPRGQIFGFLGPNAAGKTTTIRMLTGILRPSDGEGSVLGFDLYREAESIKRQIGYVAQHFGLYDNLSASENLGFYASVYGGAEPQLLAHLLERYGFGPHRNVLARNLSGGFRQRLALICALTHAPKVLFLDEPTAGVDPNVRKQLWDFFYELANSGTTLFVTTHYMEEAERCDHLAFIHHGRLIANDTPEGIKQALAGRDVFRVGSRYEPEVVAQAHRLDGVEMVNQFGNTLRLVIAGGRYDDASLKQALGLGERPQISVERDRPSIEDVFVTLTSSST
jgi:ABC-2 type transport system ATP-binding protein